MGKIRDLFKNFRDTEGTYHTKMGTTKDRNNMDQIEAENNFKKGCQEYTEELNKEDFGDPDNHDSVITHLAPDFLVCDASGLSEALLQTKLVEVMEFQLSYFIS